MESIDSLLTKYVDALNTGENPDISSFLQQCPTNDRSELKELIEMIMIYKVCQEPVKVRSSSAKTLFNKLESIRVEKQKAITRKYAANFRKDELSLEQKEKAQKELDRIWNEEFGDD